MGDLVSMTSDGWSRSPFRRPLRGALYHNVGTGTSTRPWEAKIRKREGGSHFSWATRVGPREGPNIQAEGKAKTLKGAKSAAKRAIQKGLAKLPWDGTGGPSW